jgi:multiple sugar transport system ATP-binding protein
MAEVRIRNLIKRFGNTTAVDGISLEIHDGELMVFLGPSGCGKTTTLRSIAGLEHPESGDILIGPRRVNALSPADRDIAFVFQFYALYPHLNVFDNIAFPLRAQHVPPGEIQARTRAIARVLQIESLLQRRIRQLSSGEQQRVALGRAMIRRPRVLLMDEPLTNLDAKLRNEMRAELKHLQREQRVTTVYVTHDQVEAMALGDRITVMNKGRIQQTGTPMEVYRHPANLFVAGFIGTPPMSLIACDLVVQPGRAQAVTNGFAVDLPERVTAALRARTNLRDVVIGLRPESVHLSLQQPSGAVAAFQAEVYAVEPLGDENIVDLRIAALSGSPPGQGAGPGALRARTAPAFRPRVGDKVWVTPDVAEVHVFDPSTEEAIGEDVIPAEPASPDSVQERAPL